MKEDVVSFLEESARVMSYYESQYACGMTPWSRTRKPKLLFFLPNFLWRPAGPIRLSTDLNVWLDAAKICMHSTVWRLGAYNEEVKQYFVESGGVLGNPGRETISNWFKIEKVDEDYKLVFCPTVCDTCKVICRDVGVYVDGATRRLALSDEPFRVMFKKARGAGAAPSACRLCEA
ncbi:kunitz trypsin inhibitor 5-like [Eucalyptus grandis]|uniref:kunitz trypsin inhibitor 5-like n=1 Tax=Eucalyptus grandis TaxID=71139 RepID=UPI00052573AC|nr:kunitz trypsin inhibitor 5-like [Eucalyptus grandis]